VVDNITLDQALQRTQQLFEAVAKDGGYKKKIEPVSYNIDTL
jgi:hypothetical protein